MREEIGKTLEVYWEKRTGIIYLNDGEKVSFRKAQERARNREYVKMSIGWNSQEMVPQEIYKEMKNRLSFLERISFQE